MEEICFQDKVYDARYLNLPTFGLVLIATTELSNVLLTEDYEYTSDEARHIDETICFFVDKKNLKLSSKKLITEIMKHI